MSLIQSCETILNILSLYYGFQPTLNISDFIMSHNSSTQDGQVLIHENDNEICLGVAFSQHIHNSFDKQKTMTTHQVAVLAEEMSHFKFLCDVINNDSQTTQLILETTGEIDRFLCLMHWNQFSHNKKLNYNWKNIHEICDHVFTGKRFHGTHIERYVAAENIAFMHLKEAFWNSWNCTYFNFSEIHKPAQQYLSNLRRKLLY